jgi:flagellar assembly factor FliW
MKVQFTHFGLHEIDPDSILTFPQGISGFENLTRYKLFHEEKEQPIVYWLQAIDDTEVAFSVVDPSLFGLFYEFDLTDDEIALLKTEDPNDISVMLIMYKQSTDTAANADNIRANINGPIILDTKTRRGFQKVLVQLQANITLKSEQSTPA